MGPWMACDQVKYEEFTDSRPLEVSPAPAHHLVLDPPVVSSITASDSMHCADSARTVVEETSVSIVDKFGNLCDGNCSVTVALPENAPTLDGTKSFAVKSGRVALPCLRLLRRTESTDSAAPAEGEYTLRIAAGELHQDVTFYYSTGSAAFEDVQDLSKQLEEWRAIVQDWNEKNSSWKGVCAEVLDAMGDEPAAELSECVDDRDQAIREKLEGLSRRRKQLATQLGAEAVLTGDHLHLSKLQGIAVARDCR
jgi:hypothetical protein